MSHMPIPAEDPEALYSEPVNFRTTRAMLAMVDLYAGQEDRKRAAMLRKLLAEAITARQRAAAGGRLDVAESV